MDWGLIWCQTEHLDEAACVFRSVFFRTLMWIGSCVSECAYVVYVFPSEGPRLSHRCQTERKKAGARAGFARWKNRSVQVVTKRKDSRDVISRTYVSSAFCTIVSKQTKTGTRTIHPSFITASARADVWP